MKTNLRKAISMILAMAMALSLCVLPAAAAEEGVVLKLHYHRPDETYTDWSVWFWVEGVEGRDVPMAEEDGEMVATFPVSAGATEVGFIVKLPDWAAKDVDKDQFIDVASYLSGTVHVYVESGVEGYEIKLGDDVMTGVKVKSVVYDEAKGVLVDMTAEIDPADLTVTGPEGQVKITSVSQEGNLYALMPEVPLDLYGSYTLTCSGAEYAVRMPNVYSTSAFEEAYTYAGDDLGAAWTPEQTTFRLWAPTATEVKVNLYATGDPENADLTEQLDMTPDVNGTWLASKDGDLNGVYYTYEVTVGGGTVEACDPYARTTGVNGKRAMVIDLAGTNPEGWAEDKDPHYDDAITDAVIYELHVRDLSVDENSGITNKGKFLGLIETGTTNPQGVATGLDHMKDLGITHIHLLPSYDYGSVNEAKLDTPQFNWGYDPVNYNVPEGSYSTDPCNGAVRVQEFKQMVKGLHDNGISVIMDVVYNHVYSGNEFCFNQIVPQYFSRVSDTGAFSSGSGCGNDTASERSMVSKYIVDSVRYWADEYHIDGFRFDLVGLIDTDTINAVVEQVHKTHPNVIFYGEGWTMSTEMTKAGYTLTTQQNSAVTPNFAFFSDTIRDAIKGSVFDNEEQGYVSGGANRAGVASAIANSFTATPAWCSEPTQIINYSSCHDNMTLFDRVVNSTPNASRADQIRMNNLAAAIVMTSQGVPLIHAGEEMLRSKPLADGGFDHNSYSSSDEVNNLKWADLNSQEYQAVNAYYQGLIAFRQAHPALRMTSSQEIAQTITQLEGMSKNSLGFRIAAGANGEGQDLVVLFNPNNEQMTADLPEGQWTVYINGEAAGTEALSTASGTVEVAPISAMVLAKTGEAAAAPAEETQAAQETQASSGSALPIVLAVLAVIALGAVVFFLKKRKK